jgi:hypothetical protein
MPRLLLLAALLPLLAAGCTPRTAPPAPAGPVAGPDEPALPGEGATPDDLAAARARWAAAGLDAYRYTVSRQCFCPPEYSGPYEATVRDGALASLTYAGRPADMQQFAVPTVEGLFDQIAGAYASGASSVRVTYDARLGYPTTLWIDQDPMMADEETGYTISALAAE